MKSRRDRFLAEGDEGTLAANSARVLMATACVLGLTALMFLHILSPDGRGDFQSEGNAGPAADPARAVPGFLHAPTRDPSLPDLEATMSRMKSAPIDEAPAPTF